MLLGEVVAALPWGLLLVTDEGSSEPIPDWASDDEPVSACASALVVRVLHEQFGDVRARLSRGTSSQRLPTLHRGTIRIASGVLTISDVWGEQAIRSSLPPGEHRIRLDADSAIEATAVEIVIDPADE